MLRCVGMPSALHSSCLAHRVLVSACCCLLTPRLTCHGTALPLMATWPCRDSLADCFAATGATCWCRCSGASLNLPTPPFPLCTRSIYPVPFHALTACCCCASTPYGRCLTQEKRLDQGRGPGLIGMSFFPRVSRTFTRTVCAPWQLMVVCWCHHCNVCSVLCYSIVSMVHRDR